MAVISADGLSLLVGDGGGTEVFTALKGAVLTRLEVTQKNNESRAIGADAWAVAVGASNRKAVIECEAFSTDEAPPIRLRSLALSGGLGNFKLKLSGAQTLSLSAVVTSYRETIGTGDIKRLTCRLESSGAVTIG